ncbi:SAM-dependent methyltransferase [Streptomyces akebiae]|uniref:SAM-dependent methyltransferase n=2 Tax=Streptomyces akebiae TaxID=2865673 RepID=A0ABX8Y791_9ACTN|nr:SAM-dependent methyltransferase [Streptomyces akebiae]
MQGVIDRNGQCRVLEPGDRHSNFTDHLVAARAQVMLAEMSEPSVRSLQSRFRRNPNVTVPYDKDGTSLCRAGPVDAVARVSVLRHPDRLGTVEQLIDQVVPGGAFLSAQVPLAYPCRSRLSMSPDRNAYLLGRGYGRAARLRRRRGIYDEADTVEYHVVRDGADEEALRDLLDPAFQDVEVKLHHRSARSGLLQAAGERFFPTTAFALVAGNRR